MGCAMRIIRGADFRALLAVHTAAADRRKNALGDRCAIAQPQNPRPSTHTPSGHYYADEHVRLTVCPGAPEGAEAFAARDDVFLWPGPTWPKLSLSPLGERPESARYYVLLRP